MHMIADDNGSGRGVTNEFDVLPLPSPTGVDLDAGSDTGIADDDDRTNLNNDGNTLDIIVSGTVAGADVNVYAGATLIGTATATGTVTTGTSACFTIFSATPPKRKFPFSP